MLLLVVNSTPQTSVIMRIQDGRIAIEESVLYWNSFAEKDGRFGCVPVAETLIDTAKIQESDQNHDVQFTED